MTSGTQLADRYLGFEPKNAVGPCMGYRSQLRLRTNSPSPEKKYDNIFYYTV